MKRSPAAALLERLGARGMLGIGDALKARSVRGVAGAAGRGSALEGGTETGQEGIEHLTARLGTATGIDGREMADAMMAGGAAGAIFGGGVRSATATGEALLGRPQTRKAGAGAPPAPSVPSASAQAEPGGTPAPVDARGGERPPPPTERVAVRLTGEELAPFDAPRDVLRAAALRWYNENLVDTGLTVTNEHDGRVIRFEHPGARKTKTGGDDILRLVPAIPEMLRTGRLLDSRPDRKGRRETLAWHRYMVVAEVGGQKRNVTLTVRERTDGTFHYSLHRKVESTGGGSKKTARRSSKPDSPTPL